MRALRMGRCSQKVNGVFEGKVEKYHKQNSLYFFFLHLHALFQPYSFTEFFGVRKFRLLRKVCRWLLEPDVFWWTMLKRKFHLPTLQ